MLHTQKTMWISLVLQPPFHHPIFIWTSTPNLHNHFKNKTVLKALSVLIYYHPPNKVWTSIPNLHNHFPNKTLLKALKVCTTKPPQLLGVITISHRTKWYFLASFTESKKVTFKSFQFFSNTGGGMEQRPKISGMLDKVFLISTSFSPLDKYLLCQPASLFSIK